MSRNAPSSGFRACLMALMLVLAGVAGPASMTAAAQTETDTAIKCWQNNLSELILFAISGGTDEAERCTYTSQAISDLEEQQDNQTKLDVYNALISQKAASESYRATFDNYLNDTESVAWMKAEMAIAEAYQNGSSEAVARSKAKTAIANYYAKKQINLIENWNVTAKSVHSSHKIAASEGLGEQYVDIMADNIDPDSTENPHITGNGTRSVTLTNSSTRDVVSLGYSGWFGQEGSSSLENGEVWLTGVSNDNSRTPQAVRYIVRSPDGGTNPQQTILTRQEYEDRFYRIDTQMNALQAEVDPFVNATWDDFQAGTINSSDVLSRNTLMFEYGIDATNGSSSNLYNSVAALSTMGLDTPNLNGTGTMAVTYENIEYHGLVMAREAPNGTWEANTTYNASDIGGPVVLVTTDGQRKEMTGEFRIGTISAQDGTDLANVSATKVVYRTANTSDLLNKMDAIVKLRDEIEALQLSAGGTGDGSSSSSRTRLIIGALALAGVAALAMRKEENR